MVVLTFITTFTLTTKTNKMNTLENNKLIAEFMGGEFNRKYTAVTTKEGFNSIGALKYHTSWDWLTPVVAKCLIDEAEQAEEISMTTIKNIYDAICNQDINGAYNSVIDFISWYNKNSAKEN